VRARVFAHRLARLSDADVVIVDLSLPFCDLSKRRLPGNFPNEERGVALSARRCYRETRDRLSIDW